MYAQSNLWLEPGDAIRITQFTYPHAGNGGEPRTTFRIHIAGDGKSGTYLNFYTVAQVEEFVAAATAALDLARAERELIVGAYVPPFAPSPAESEILCTDPEFAPADAR